MAKSRRVFGARLEFLPQSRCIARSPADFTVAAQYPCANRTFASALKDTGVPLEMAAIHFAEARKILNGASHLDASRFYAKHHRGNLAKKSVPEVVAEFMEAESVKKQIPVS